MDPAGSSRIVPCSHLESEFVCLRKNRANAREFHCQKSNPLVKYIQKPKMSNAKTYRYARISICSAQLHGTGHWAAAMARCNCRQVATVSDFCKESSLHTYISGETKVGKNSYNLPKRWQMQFSILRESERENKKLKQTTAADAASVCYLYQS